MKTPFPRQPHRRIQSILPAIAAIISLPLGMPSAGAAEDAAKHLSDITEKARQAQERMSKHFRDTWQELRESVDAKARSKFSVSTASVDLREQNDGFTIRVNLPGHDVEKTEVTLMNGNTLRILAPAGEKSGRYEQTLVLDGLAAEAKPHVEKRPQDHLIVIHLPKSATAAKPEPKTPEMPPETLPLPSDGWDRAMLERMERMHREMDEMFHHAFEDMPDLPGELDFFDQARFGSSVEVREEDGQYIVRAYLPDRDAENVKVTIDGERVLKIDAVAEETAGKDGEDVITKRKSHYSQLLTLPGPVDAAQLKVDRKKGMLVISVPKKPQP